jgi:hypothetical protein
MSWLINCSKCGKKTKASNIVDLISRRNKDGWFLGQCGHQGYVEKNFKTQEGSMWEPYLRGIIPLGTRGRVYQPFVFLVSNGPKKPANDIWFSYYKDLRNKKGRKKGRLKVGYGPGGPPVLDTAGVLDLLRKLVKVGRVSQRQIADALK